MVDSCRQLTISQNNGDEDTAGMVTILTGHHVEELSSRSAAMKVSPFYLHCTSTGGMKVNDAADNFNKKTHPSFNFTF